jgi:hypothetical protein
VVTISSKKMKRARAGVEEAGASKICRRVAILFLIGFTETLPQGMI